MEPFSDPWRALPRDEKLLWLERILLVLQDAGVDVRDLFADVDANGEVVLDGRIRPV
jgi:hypothetical protein